MGVLDQVERYIDRLKPAIRKEMTIKNPQTMATAIEYATNYDATVFGYNRNASSSNYKPRNQMQHTRNNAGSGEDMDLDSMKAKKKTNYQKNKYHNNNGKKKKKKKKKNNIKKNKKK